MSLVVIGASDPDLADAAIQAFEGAGFRTATELRDPGGADVLVVLGRGAPEQLRSADELGLKYQLVHVGEDDGVVGGSFQRAHHRVSTNSLAELAEKLKTRSRLLVRVVAFGYKHGLPPLADWVIDARFLKNPYWVEELRHLDGRDARVSEYVLGQGAAAALVERLVPLFEAVLPEYVAQGRTEVTIAFGCTGGRHRSVALANELAARLEGRLDADLEPAYREL